MIPIKTRNDFKFGRSILLGLLGLGLWTEVDRVDAASITLGLTTPAVGVGAENLIGATNTSNNADVEYANSDYLAGDNNGSVGQTFTTGTNSAGYWISAISVRQVGYSTYWDYAGGTIAVQIFQMNTPDLTGGHGTENITVLDSETATVGGTPAFGSGTPTPEWLTVTLATPIFLVANTQYGFQLGSTGTGANSQFILELDGTSSDVHAGGSALIGGTGSTPSTTAIWTGGYNPGDLVFVPYLPNKLHKQELATYNKAA